MALAASTPLIDRLLAFCTAWRVCFQNIPPPPQTTFPAFGCFLFT
ncbi:hypothetical protein ARMA_1769 [Ardenticatena maritima]|uniref:Uncharacterized protein n=1 Tax=Ardenticatena maritima TaxID=872965 RepID=A0A0M8KA19_9CHLR|nr:hypothetical protein ARMA_1769 [Ardenticatena maritima]